MFGFGNKQQQQPAQQQQQAQQQPGNQQQNVQQPQNGGQSGNGQNAGSNTPADPLAIYGKMFDNPTQTDAPPSFSIDPKVMDGVVSSQDFMSGLNPEVMQKAQQGDWNAITEMIQHTSRQAYRAAIEHGGVLTDKFVGAREQYGNKSLPSRVRQELTSNELANTPNFQNPVVKKQLTQIASRLETLHPDATPQEIARMSRQYLTDMASAIQDPASNQQQQATQGTDWDKFFADDAS